MKKILSVLMILAMVFTAAMAEENTFGFHDGAVTFGMNMDQVMAAETAQYHEIDTEHTHGSVAFGELEYENILVNNKPADLKYLFVGNELVAIRINFEDRSVTFDQAKEELSALFGETGAVDTATLANGIYAVDDDGRLEARAEAITTGNVMIVIEEDEDDVDVTFVDLNAAYISAQ